MNPGDFVRICDALQTFTGDYADRTTLAIFNIPEGSLGIFVEEHREMNNYRGEKEWMYIVMFPSCGLIKLPREYFEFAEETC